ncbi:MAG TPA: metallophosphoesterase [Phycisphaerales bacterium]|nr:metallophosphoesterase [Phycisphaerales bacterium]
MQSTLNPAVLPLPETLNSADQKPRWQALRRLPDGPLDLVGDIHGEIDALRALMRLLGYDGDGGHPEGRTLVFLGDLIDRGTDSAAVVRLVQKLVQTGRACAVMGNHDLNAVAGARRDNNGWIFGHKPLRPGERPATAAEREEVLSFLATLPLAMEREDLRVVHAHWDDAGLAMLAGESGPAEALARHAARVKQELGDEPNEVVRGLAKQNRNPMKLITSGPEVAAPNPHYAGGQWRNEQRNPWWERYDGEKWVVFGHYWRLPVTGIQQDDGLLSKYAVNEALGNGRAMCIDYSVGGSWWDRSEGRFAGPFVGRLAAMRWPERELVFDDGERMPVVPPAGSRG